MVDKKETAESPTGDTGEQEKAYTQADVDALLAPEIEKRKVAERASSMHGEKVKQLEASQGDWQSDIQTLRQEMTQNMQLMAALASEGRPPEDTEGLSPTEKGDYLKKAQALIAQNEAKRTEQAYFRKCDAIYARAEKLYGDDIDALHNIRNLIRSRDLDLAEKKIARAEAKLGEEGKPPESEEERQKAIEEEARRQLEEKGLLKTDISGPSGASKRSFTAAEIGEMSYQEWVDAGKPGVTREK